MAWKLFTLVILALCTTLLADITPQEHWSTAYLRFHDILEKHTRVDGPIHPIEIEMIRDNSTLSFVTLDSFSVQVLKEADLLFLAYRNSIQKCVEALDQNEYRTQATPSYG